MARKVGEGLYRCPDCGKVLPVSEYSTTKGRPSTRCKVCHRAYNKKNRARATELARLWRARNPEKVQASRVRYREKRNAWQREYQKRTYHQRRGEGGSWMNPSQSEKNAWLAAKKAVPCADCGQQFPSYCKDFHHRDPRDKDCTIRAQLSWPRLQAEVAKCDVLCANCHRIRHWRLRHPEGDLTHG